MMILNQQMFCSTLTVTVWEKKQHAFLFLHVVTILTCWALSYGVYALTTMPMVFFFSAKFHW